MIHQDGNHPANTRNETMSTKDAIQIRAETEAAKRNPTIVKLANGKPGIVLTQDKAYSRKVAAMQVGDRIKEILVITGEWGHMTDCKRHGR